MINNRQNGRRRGRGGGQRQGGGGQGQRDSGNRIDSRARGNAAQLLEKYRNMARDAQMSGDRVNFEYYLQFADHYFRVLADQRGRTEDGQPQRRMQRDEFDQFDMDDDFGSDFAGEGEPIRSEEQPRASENDAQQRRDRDDRPRYNGRDRDDRPQRADRDDRPQRAERADRDDRPQRADRDDRPQRADRPDRGERPDRAERQPRANGHAPQDGDGEHRFARPAPVPAANDVEVAPAAAAPVEAELPLADAQGDAPRRRGRPRKVRDEQPADAPVALDAERLPPAIGAPVADDMGDDAPKPRRRRTRAAAEVTPAE